MAASILISLMASGISSSVVGTMAGQVIMQGFVGWRTPVWVRRLVTMLPAFAVVAAGADATGSLILSEVVLSLALPVPMVVLRRRREVMGARATGEVTFAGAVGFTVAIVATNAALLLQQAG